MRSRLGREAVKLPIQADRAQRRGANQLIVGDVVDLEGAAVDVALHQIGSGRVTNQVIGSAH